MPKAHGSIKDEATTLNVKGASIPKLGFGTYGMSGSGLQKILVEALRGGFRHIDTAQIYHNEEDVGAAVSEAGIPRADLFITTKVWVSNYAPERFMASVDRSLQQLGTDYIDLLLVHWPNGGAPLESQIEGLNEAARSGRTRHIGVSNYNAAMLDKATTLSERPLVTNQVEYHPYLDQSKLLKTVREKETSLMAYCAMAVGRVFKEPLLKEIAERQKRTISQVVLRWLIQQPHVVTLSRTSKADRIPENFDIFDFSLSAEDMRSISGLHAPHSRIVNPPGLAPDW
jgi:2,5-diketo-D-gluconate reductase B